MPAGRPTSDAAAIYTSVGPRSVITPWEANSRLENLPVCGCDSFFRTVAAGRGEGIDGEARLRVSGTPRAFGNRGAWSGCRGGESQRSLVVLFN